MFSDHLKTIDALPAKKLLFVAGGLVLVGQLVAMGMVVGSQVEKAQLRQASQASIQSAMTSCAETRHGLALRDCTQLASTPTDADQVIDASLPQAGSAPVKGISLVALPDRY